MLYDVLAEYKEFDVSAEDAIDDEPTDDKLIIPKPMEIKKYLDDNVSPIIDRAKYAYDNQLNKSSSR